jgi:transcriptional regulator with XRE-family HTH domain
VSGRFGLLLRHYRLRAELTQEELAEMSGVSAHTLSLLETGRRAAPRLRSARLLADALKLAAGDRADFLRRATLAEPRSPHSAAWSLPYDVPDFVGRTGELRSILRACPPPDVGRLVILLIDGMAGVGKTALAVRAAHRLASQYPDAQLYCDLHGYSEEHEPSGPADALAVLLRMAGVGPEAIPVSPHQRVALWQSILARRRVLVLLDNVMHADQVRPLIPSHPGSLVCVTSRRRLSDLDGATRLSLDVLPSGDATELFARASGGDRAHNRAAVAEIVRLCGYLPLAVRAAAVRLANRPSWTADELVARLRDPTRRLAELGATTAFELSARLLGSAQLRLFHLLAQLGEDEFDVPLAASLAGVPPRRAADLLEELVDHHLLVQHAPGRYSFHVLILCQAMMDASSLHPVGQ